MKNRRTFLAGIGTVGTVSIAGCSSSIPIIGGGGPEEAVKQYVAAQKDGNVEKANEVVYTGGRRLREDDLQSEGELLSTREMSSAELAEEGIFGIESEEGVREIKNDIKSETDADEVAFVMVEVERNGETNKGTLPVIKIDGDWMVVLG